MKIMTVDRINSLLDGTGYHIGYKSAGKVSSLYKLINTAGDEVLCDRTLKVIRIKATELTGVDLISD
jgi:hypothetical protein